jgi:hypothetical protein
MAPFGRARARAGRRGPLLAELVRAGFRVLVRKHHPDVGGKHETMPRLNRLMERLRQEVLTA